MTGLMLMTCYSLIGRWSLLPSAHATVFILGADIGVSKSDLAIWRDHLSGDSQSRFVVLNKIDAMTKEEISEKAAQLKKACKQTPLRISGASQKGVPETVQKLFQIVTEHRRAEREAQIEAEMTPEEKSEGWKP